MAKRDYYDVLGVQKNASDQDIKKALEILQKKITQIEILETKKQKLVSKKLTRLMKL